MAQIRSEDKNDYLDADYYFYIKDYDKALNILLSLHPRYPKHGNMNYLIGASYILGKNNSHKALGYLKTAIKDINENYRSGNLKYSGAPPDAWLFYGDALHADGQFQEASKAYHNYLNYVQNDEIAKDMAIRRILGIGISYEGYLRAPGLIVKNMGKLYNTEGNEFRPAVSGNGKTMVYISNTGTSNRIFYMQKLNGNWLEPVDITRELGSDGNFYISSLTYHGNRLYLIKQDRTNSDIYESNLEDGTWSKISALSKRINSAYNETGACVSTDGKKLYFSSDRQEGYGGIDIYSSELIKGKWAKPVNLESSVNTSFDDDSPIISYSGDSLFFSTNGRESIGKMDIFVTVKSEDGQWGSPENIGLPYNTVENDYLGMYIKKDGKAYLSQMHDEGFGQMDIVYITKDELPVKSPDRLLTEKMEKEPDTLSEELLTQKDFDDVDDGQITTEVIAEHPGTRIIGEKAAQDGIEKITEGKAAEQVYEKTKPETNNVVPEQNTASINDSPVVKGKEDIPEVKPQGQKAKENIPVNTLIVKEQVKRAKTSEIHSGMGIYTIQLMALRKLKEKSVIRNIDLGKVKISHGNDGYVRYTYGEYNTVKEAQEALKQLFYAGHKNAFIKEINLIDNY